MAGSGLGLARVGFGIRSGATRHWQGFHPHAIERRPGLDPGETQVKGEADPAKRRI